MVWWRIYNKLLIILIFISLTAKTTFCVNLATVGLDQSLMDTYIAEDESENDEIKIVVYDFVHEFIRPQMTDFEKEILIIKYLVETVEYDIEEAGKDEYYLNDSYKAYGALVNHKAVCSGYAKAFDLLAKTCGLSSTVVTGEAINSENLNGPHAWNQVYLDGEWYNVDVTFEDPITNLKLGFDQTLNKYINCTDIEFSTNHIRENGHTCTATKYGKNVVAYYLNTGIVDLNANLDNLRKLMEQQIVYYSIANQVDEMQKIVDKLLLLGAKYDDNSNFISSNNDLEITNYILTKLALGENIVTVVTGSNTQNSFAIDTGHFLDDYINVPMKLSMHRFFSSDGVYDTRILVFVRG